MRNLTLLMLLLGALSGCTSNKKTVWIYTSIYKEVIEEMKSPLAKAVPDVQIEWFQSGSENIASKVNAELAAGRTKADLILTSDPFWYYELKQQGKLMNYQSPAAKGIPAEFSDPDHAFVGGRLPVMVIGYNSEAVAAADLPKTWKDLLHPKWKGKLSMPSPMESGTSFSAVAMLSSAYGWDYFSALRKQDILAAGGNSSVITRIETKERPVGIVLLENILKAWGKGSPVRPIYPDDGIIPIVSPVAIMKDTPNPEIAKKVYDWFLTPEAQKAMVKSGMYSFLPGFESPPNAKPFSELRPKMMKWNSDVLRGLFDQRTTIKEKFSSIVIH